MVRRMAPVKGLSDSHGCHGVRVTRVNIVACVPADEGPLCRTGDDNRVRGGLLSPMPTVNSESSRNIGSIVGNLGVNNEDSSSKRNGRGLPAERLR